MQPPVYGEDEVTDRSERFLAAEMVREQLMLRLDQELPYATTVEIEQFTDRPDGMAEIHAMIWVERDGQKAIVIGNGGAQLKAIGTSARRHMERTFERKVFLQPVGQGARRLGRRRDHVEEVRLYGLRGEG